MQVLVIKLGALGDFVQAFPAFEAIRAHHGGSRITLLTTRPFVALAEKSPWFDQIEVDSRPRWRDLAGMARLRRQLSGYDVVYDLQTSGRSSWYARFAGSANWSGIGGGATLPHDNPARNEMHTRTRQIDQLRVAGINMTTADTDVAWLSAPGLTLQRPYALLVPGAAAHRPRKRWPVERFALLADKLLRQGILPVLIGSDAEGALAREITSTCEGVMDLVGKTSLTELGGLGANALFAVGNDTGPMHLFAAVGCRCVVLFSDDSKPSLTAPVGRSPGQVQVIAVDDLATLSVDRVAGALQSGH